jgi:hypothetical protein
MTAALTSREVLDSIERSFDAKGGYLVIREIALGVRDGRRADAIALQLYESRGIHLHGFEVKVSRSDWLRELKDAAKADELVRSGEYFSIVAAAGIVDPNELPTGWGLFEVRGADRRLHRVVAAARRDDPEPLSLVGNARILRRMIEALRAPGEVVRRELLEAEYLRGVKDGEAPGRPRDLRRRRAPEAAGRGPGLRAVVRHRAPDVAGRGAGRAPG